MIQLAAEMSDCPKTSTFVHNSIIELYKEARDFRSRLRDSNDDNKQEEDRRKKEGGNQEKNKQPKGIKKRDGTKRKKRFKSCVEHFAKKSRSLAEVRSKELNAPISYPTPPALQALPQVQSFTSMLMAPLDCSTPSLEELQEEEFVLSGEGPSSIIASTMSNQFLAGEGPSSMASTIFSQHGEQSSHHLQ